MAKKDDISRCYTSSQLINYAQSHGGQVVRQSGSHAIVKGQHGICPIPCHPGDLAKGTRHAIIKMLAVILGLMFFGCALIANLSTMLKG